MNQPAFLGVIVLLAVGSFGWGRLLTSALDGIGTRAPTLRRLEPPLVLTTGIGVVLALGGIAVACDEAKFTTLVAILGIGAAVTFVGVLKRLSSTRLSLPSARAAWVLSAFALVGFLAYGAALTGPINPNDDDPGYLYLAARLLATGGMNDPFNMRRIVSYGGGEIFQALVVRVASSGAALGVEWFFFVLLLTALVVGRASRPFAAPIALLVGLGLTVIHPVGAWANSAPTFSGVALTFGVLQLVAIASRHDRDWRYDVVTGVLLGGLLALRYQFAIPAVIIVVLCAAAFRRLGCWRSIATSGAAAVATLLGWAVALDRSSGTPLFPVFGGTYNEAFPWADPSFRTTAQYVSRLWGEIGTNAWGAEMVAVVVAGIVLVLLGRALWSSREVAVTSVVLASGLLGCAALVVTETRALAGGVLADIGRYNAPSVLAVVLFALDRLWVLACARAAAPPGAQRDEHPSWWATRLPAITCATMAAAMYAIPLGGTFPAVPPYGTPVHAVAHATYDEGEYAIERIDGALGSTDRLAAQRPAYGAINAVVPRGADVLAAVSTPELLDFSRFRFATLDIAGGASPAPGIPLTKGGAAVMGYLQHLGYNGIVASVTSAPGLDNYKAWAANLTSGIEDYRAMAVEFVAWAHDLSGLSHDPSVHRVRIGSLEYLSWSKPSPAR